MIRELIGSGSLLGFTILSGEIYQRNIVFILAPGAFFSGGFLIWILNGINPPKKEG